MLHTASSKVVEHFTAQDLDVLLWHVVLHRHGNQLLAPGNQVQNDQRVLENNSNKSITYTKYRRIITEVLSWLNRELKNQAQNQLATFKIVSNSIIYRAGTIQSLSVHYRYKTLPICINMVIMLIDPKHSLCCWNPKILILKLKSCTCVHGCWPYHPSRNNLLGVKAESCVWASHLQQVGEGVGHGALVVHLRRQVLQHLENALAPRHWP